MKLLAKALVVCGHSLASATDGVVWPTAHSDQQRTGFKDAPSPYNRATVGPGPGIPLLLACRLDVASTWTIYVPDLFEHMLLDVFVAVFIVCVRRGVPE